MIISKNFEKNHMYSIYVIGLWICLSSKSHASKIPTACPLQDISLWLIKDIVYILCGIIISAATL